MINSLLSHPPPSAVHVLPSGVRRRVCDFLGTLLLPFETRVEGGIALPDASNLEEASPGSRMESTTILVKPHGRSLYPSSWQAVKRKPSLPRVAWKAPQSLSSRVEGPLLDYSSAQGAGAPDKPHGRNLTSPIRQAAFKREAPTSRVQNRKPSLHKVALKGYSNRVNNNSSLALLTSRLNGGDPASKEYPLSLASRLNKNSFLALLKSRVREGDPFSPRQAA